MNFDEALCQRVRQRLAYHARVSRRNSSSYRNCIKIVIDLTPLKLYRIGVLTPRMVKMMDGTVPFNFLKLQFAK